MKDSQWFRYFENTNQKFKWFFLEYGYVEDWKWLKWAFIHRDKDPSARVKMTNIMNKVWLELPDSKFNIMQNPPGWHEFLYLLGA